MKVSNSITCRGAMRVGSVIELSADELSRKEMKKLLTGLTFFDDERNEVRSYRLMGKGRLVIPRGAWALLPDTVEYVDNRVMPDAPSVRFKGTLDSSTPDKSFSGQQDALEACLREEQGIVVRGPGTGKTMIALALIAKLKTQSLVLVHTEDIFQQWIEYAEKVLPDADIGTIRGSNWTLGKLTVAMVQTVRQDFDRFKSVARRFGCVIADEAHHVPAATWEVILNNCPGKYRIGFTATDKRSDGMQPLMLHLLGPVIHRTKLEIKVPTRVIPLKSKFKFAYRGRFDWMPLQAALCVDEDRNELIAQTAARQLRKGRSSLILSRRIEHLDQIFEHLKGQLGASASWNLDLGLGPGWIDQVKILTGSVPRPERLKMIQDFRAGKIKILLATQLADEALDVPILSCVFLTYPGKHDGRIIQQVGRALREHPDKHNAVIFDVVDDRISVLRRQWMERKQAYSTMGIPVKKHELEAAHTERQRKRTAALNIRKRMRRR
jgi:superfamily II DNA or RNA helicase